MTKLFRVDMNLKQHGNNYTEVTYDVSLEGKFLKSFHSIDMAVAFMNEYVTFPRYYAL